MLTQDSREKRTIILLLGVTILVVLATLLYLLKFDGLLNFGNISFNNIPMGSERNRSELRWSSDVVAVSSKKAEGDKLETMIKGAETINLDATLDEENSESLDDLLE